MLVSLICLFGLDGSGKTTIAKRIVESLRSEGFNVVYAHPKLGMRIWVSESVDDAVPIGEIRVRRTSEGLWRIGVILLACVLLVENWLTIQMRVKLQISRGKVVVVERYWPDSLVDLAVDFGMTFEKARRMTKPLDVRAPSEYFHLDTPTQIALARKPGPYTFEYLNRRDEAYRKLAKAIGATVVDAQETPEQIVNHVLHQILNNGEELPCQQS